MVTTTDRLPPWAPLIDEERDGRYAGFAAWESWFRREPYGTDGLTMGEALDAVDDVDFAIWLYSLMCRLHDGSIPPAEARP